MNYEILKVSEITQMYPVEHQKVFRFKCKYLVDGRNFIVIAYCSDSLLDDAELFRHIMVSVIEHNSRDMLNEESRYINRFKRFIRRITMGV